LSRVIGQAPPPVEVRGTSLETRAPGGRVRGSQARTSTCAGCGLPGQVRRPPYRPDSAWPWGCRWAAGSSSRARPAVQKPGCLDHRTGAKSDGIRRQMRRSSARGWARSREDGGQPIFFRDHLLLIAAVPDDQLSEPSGAGIVTTSGCSAALSVPRLWPGFRGRACRGIGAARQQMIDQVWRS